MKKILVIEDEKILLETIYKCLKLEGYEVTKADNGLTGIKAARSKKFDLIISDIMMPDADGYFVIKALKDNSELLPPSFIIMTSGTERKDQRLSMELGADDFITKPFKTEELLKAVKVQLNKRDIIAAKLNLVNEIVNRAPKKSVNTDNKKESIERLDYEANFFISDYQRSDFIKISRITYIEAAKDYTVINLEDKKNFIVRKSLTAWQKILPEKQFTRIHRSVIINSNYVEKVLKDSSNTFKLYLKDIPKPLTISQRYARMLKNLFI